MADLEGSVSITGNTIRDTRLRAIHIEDASAVVAIAGNTIIGVSELSGTRTGFFVQDSNNVTISGNVFKDFPNAGYIDSIDAASVNPVGVVVSGNVFTSCGPLLMSGVSSPPLKDVLVQVTDNLFLECSGEAINNLTFNGVQVRGNTLHAADGNTSYAIRMGRNTTGHIISDNVFRGFNGKEAALTNTGVILFNDVFRLEYVDVVSASSPATIGPVTVCDLGSWASGVLAIDVRVDSANTKKQLVSVAWNGTTMTPTTDYTNTIGNIGTITVAESSGALTVSAAYTHAGAIDLTATISLEFRGQIYADQVS